MNGRFRKRSNDGPCAESLPFPTGSSTDFSGEHVGVCLLITYDPLLASTAFVSRVITSSSCRHPLTLFATRQKASSTLRVLCTVQLSGARQRVAQFSPTDLGKQHTFLPSYLAGPQKVGKGRLLQVSNPDPPTNRIRASVYHEHFRLAVSFMLNQTRDMGRLLHTACCIQCYIKNPQHNFAARLQRAAVHNVHPTGKALQGPALFHSPLTLTKIASEYSSARASNFGRIILQGPHHVVE